MLPLLRSTTRGTTAPRRRTPKGGSEELPGAPGALGLVPSLPRGKLSAGWRDPGGGSIELPGAPRVLASVSRVATVARGNHWWIRPKGSSEGPSRFRAPRVAPWLVDLRGARPALAAGVRFLALSPTGAPGRGLGCCWLGLNPRRSRIPEAAITATGSALGSRFPFKQPKAFPLALDWENPGPSPWAP